ncbi:acylneuraminate cytidylyltransferase family protein [Tessaracoccus sp. MC1627]|uniref:acylneuraminate cytidylyltransferase family protein n=1 Tax=Tessaracoccus sp. MC1627 TaxID=2760312 RepID=UPI0016022A84|nr:acylneuraminate cytidylyltransferase family protein [Tessaracoccus sp. MC1627]MBB1513207.1 acylneuraminate cytidylyltransferase family protein [Tessaracoccus sp. MC1627]MBB1513460.1 acylneuraminate cytidylyltransferase family protein [Tessaracoccus sp. MC1627]
MTNVCVIPVRGGSKGIPRKNLLPIAGKPLVVWTIEQALAVPGLRVIVSTEDAEIAAVSRDAGAEVIDRPTELAQDTTASEPVIGHAIATLTERGERPDVVMFLQATSPVRLPGTLARALAEFEASGADSLLSVVPETPFLWNPGHPATADYDFTRRPRRQDIAPAGMKYRENGSLYVTRTEIYETLHNRLGGHIELFVLDEVEAIDIDTPADFARAEQVLRSIDADAARPVTGHTSGI